MATIPCRQLTAGPQHHWFGYYDKQEFDPSGRYVLGMAVDFEDRMPAPDDRIRLGMVDLEDNDRWTDLGSSGAWCWQQGCMLQWLPGHADEIVYNDRHDDAYVSRVRNVRTGATRRFPCPIYSITPDGRYAVAPDFRRVNDMRPGYGYEGLADPWADQLRPADSGVWRLDFETGAVEQIISIEEVAAIPHPTLDLSEAKHYFNHLLVSPSGDRFIFLHRWRMSDGGGFGTRMFTAALDGSDLRCVAHVGNSSHFIWRDPEHILVYIYHHPEDSAYYLIDDPAASMTKALASDYDGHVTYLPNRDWILTDTYPKGEPRQQDLLLCHLPSGAQHVVAQFAHPNVTRYTGPQRCDLHPRQNQDGTRVVVDSITNADAGRQLYLLDIADWLAENV